MIILGIDTSGQTASCAVTKDGAIIALKTVMTKRTHSRVILPYVTSLMEELSIGLEDIDLVAVANGPGSYTGLRIGVSTVKGLCYDNKRCIGISTLEGLAANCLCAACRIVPVMYARPGTVYFGAYISDGERLIPQQPDRVGSVDDLLALLEGAQGRTVLTGDYAAETITRLGGGEEVVLAPAAARLQSASGICQAALWHPGEDTDARGLFVSYLQITKAEKDLNDKLA